MNIFVYDPNPKLSALWLDDVRKNKMITETAQMFTALFDMKAPYVWAKFRNNRVNYPKSVLKHPCTLWLNESWGNFYWTLRLLEHYIDQWGTHKSARILKPCYSVNSVPEPQTPFCNAARSLALGLDFTYVPCTHTAYRLYHIERWKRDKKTPTWNRGERPPWY